MIFKILATGQSSAMTSTPNTGYLIEDQWDDWFQYSTMYDLYIVDSLSHQCYMGKTKIGQKGMVEDQRRPALPESFSRLSEDFFSLGQDSYYYENIKNLGDVMRSEILAALNDIAYNTKLIRTAQKEPVTKKSLLRSVPLTTVKEQFNRIALGGARLTPYNFEYRSVPIREGIEPITIEFNVDPDSYPPSNIHVIIGRNGVGKTYLISNMIRSIIQPRNNLRENVGETRFLHDKQTAVDHFSRIVFVSFSAFDELNFKTKSEKFVRIGLPAHSGENTHEHLNKIFAASFSACLHGPQRMLLTKVLHMLTSDLEPLKSLLPPHNDVLLELFGVSSAEVIEGLEKLRYSLSQGYADAIMELGKEFELFVEAVDSGISPEDARKHAEGRTSKIAGKLHGSDLINVAAITGWDSRFIDMLSYGINECSTFWGESEFAGWPIVELPVTKRPFIKIDGISYAFLYYALFDNIYRNIQKGIMQRKLEYLEDWKEKQTQASEEMVKELFLKLLPGAEAHVSNYYPVKSSLKKTNENDIIITYQNNLFVIEVKAGSFPSTPPITDFEAHTKAYRKLAEVADSQCSRTVEYIANHAPAQFYDHEKNPTFLLPGPNTFDDVFTFSVTVDNFNEFAAKAEKLSIISLKEETIVISYDDLLAYAGYFDEPIRFLHYLKQRKAAMRVPQYQMYDEFDHLGLYIDRNLYALDPS